MNNSAYRSGVSEPLAVLSPPAQPVWTVIDVDTGATVGVVASPGNCESLLKASQRAMELYGLAVGSFRVEMKR
jgi:hypothetical protein